MKKLMKALSLLVFLSSCSTIPSFHDTVSSDYEKVEKTDITLSKAFAECELEDEYLVSDVNNFNSENNKISSKKIKLDNFKLDNSPKNVILSSSLGALIRSIDTMFNKKSTMISRTFSENSFKLLFNNLPKVLKKNNNLEYWSNMQWGAYLSMAAHSNSANGPSAAVAYFLSSNYNISQGLSYAISGIYFFERNHQKGFYEYSKLFDLIEKKPNKKSLSKREKSKFVIHSLIEILKHNKLTLKNANIPKNANEKILQFISKAFNKSRYYKAITLTRLNNPIILSKKDLIIIINKILNKKNR